MGTSDMNTSVLMGKFRKDKKCKGERECLKKQELSNH